MKVSSVRNCDCRDSGGVSHRTTGLPVGIYAARADMLRRAGRIDEALDDYRQAVELSGNNSEKQYLRARLEKLAVELKKSASKSKIN